MFIRRKDDRPGRHPPAKKTQNEIITVTRLPRSGSVQPCEPGGGVAVAIIASRAPGR